MSTPTETLLDWARERAVLRSREVEEAGIPQQYLSRLVDQGQLIRIGRGLYQHPGRISSKIHPSQDFHQHTMTNERVAECSKHPSIRPPTHTYMRPSRHESEGRLTK